MSKPRNPPPSGRTVLINVEAGTWEDHHKVWPHLGINYVGTAAAHEGYEVVLHDEFIQGPVSLDKLVCPGDIVGLSLLTTGIERGVVLARLAKQLGATVVAGNDASMQRNRQLLALPRTPFDAIFTSNSLVSVGEFYRQARTTAVAAMRIPHVATSPRSASFVANEVGVAKAPAHTFGVNDFFTVPDLALYGQEYWGRVWKTYREQYGHKHLDAAQVKNALVQLAQGCPRAGAGDQCKYCAIAHVADVVVPDASYLERTFEAYERFGINTLFNVTDSSYEMAKLARQLRTIGAYIDTLVLYGRAQAIAQRPELLDEWLRVVGERLLLNCGIDSADERMLQHGIAKSASKTGSRLEENRRAVRRIRDAGPKAHLHFSLIFGSPGETVDSCKRNLDFLQWTIDMLGEQLDVCEADIWWLNFGAPCAAIFHDYEEAQQLAALAGKSITQKEWRHHFARHANALVVPWSCEEDWYRFFTRIDIDTAREYNAQVSQMMRAVSGRIAGRTHGFRLPPG